MKLGISLFAGDAGKSGISQYMQQLVTRLPLQSDDDQYVLFMAKDDVQHFGFKHERIHLVAMPNWQGHPMVNLFWHVFYFPFLLKRYGCNVVWMPAGNRRLSWFYGMPSIATVHDMSQLHIPAKYDPLRMFYTLKVLPFFMRKLDKVISISRSTRRDLVSFANIDPERIHLVYNGADLQRFAAVERASACRVMAKELGFDTPYILYIARLEHPGKNHVRLLHAYASLKQQGLCDLPLVLAGSPWNGAEVIEQTVQELALQDDVVFLGFVKQELLIDLYVAAKVFVFPSLFEGFGLPVLEAMAAGTPVCAANVSSIPEVAGDAAELFDPEDEVSIAQALAKVLADEDLQQQMIVKGYQQAKSFSWDDAAEQTWSLCRSLAK